MKTKTKQKKNKWNQMEIILGIELIIELPDES